MRGSTRALLVSLAVVTAMGAAVTAALAAPPAPYTRPGQSELVSVTSDGKQANGGLAAERFAAGGTADLSADGRYLAFTSISTDLVPNDTNATFDVFWRDRRLGLTRRVSVASDGAQAISPPFWGGSAASSITPDGRYVAFHSSAVNLVPGDTNLVNDIFVHDTRSRTTTRVSVATNGAQGNGGSNFPAMSADGRYVAFTSSAENLVAGDTNKSNDVFVRDVKARKTFRASLTSTGTQATGSSSDASLSADGRYLAFTSSAHNIVPGDTLSQLCACAPDDVYWRDLRTGRTKRVSVASDGSQASFAVFPTCTIGGISQCGSRSGYAGRPHYMSGDGRYVAFESNATNLVPNDTNYRPAFGGTDTFVHDVVTGRTERTSVDSFGHDRPMEHGEPTMSSSGRYIGYTAYDGPNCWLPETPLPIGSDETCNATEAHIYDRQTGTTESLAVPLPGQTLKPGPCSGLQRTTGSNVSIAHGGGITPDGRYIGFLSSYQNLDSGDSNRACDLFVRDRGPAVGSGGFGGNGSGSGRGSEEVCVADGVCLPPLSSLHSAAEARAPFAAQGADLIAARVALRPALGDLFVRLDLARMPSVAGTPSGGHLYGLAFTVGDQRFEVRAQRVPGADFDAKGGASFGLFREDPATGVFTKVATLKGGYGTTGPSVVVVVPLKDLGVAAGGRLSDVRAFTGLGSFLTGATTVLDAIRLVR